MEREAEEEEGRKVATEVASLKSDCEMESSEEKWQWPVFRGDYVLGDLKSQVAVVTLASHLDVCGAAISGPCKTENLGVEKVVANLISNPKIRFLIICGRESKGHLPGDAISALHRNGIDQDGKIIGAKGAIPFIQNLSPGAILRFQSQIQVIDRTGLEDLREINEIVSEHRSRLEPYPDGPFFVAKPRPRRYDLEPKPGARDVSFGSALGSSTSLDTSSWLVGDEGPRAENCQNQKSQEEEVV